MKRLRAPRPLRTEPTPSYPQASRRHFLRALAGVGFLVAGVAPSVAHAEPEKKKRVFEDIRFGGNIMLSVYRRESDDEEAYYAALAALHPVLLQHMEAIVALDLNDDKTRSTVEKLLLSVISEAVAPAEVISVTLDVDCGEEECKKVNVKGRRKLPKTFVPTLDTDASTGGSE